MQSHTPTPSPGCPFAFSRLAPPIIPSALKPRARPRADSSLLYPGETRDARCLHARCLALTFTSRYPAAIPLISASPHLSGPWRAATLIRRPFVRGVSLETIMAGVGGKGKKKATGKAFSQGAEGIRGIYTLKDCTSRRVAGTLREKRWCTVPSLLPKRLWFSLRLRVSARQS